MTEDPNFGPLIVFGLGGVFVEVMKDVMVALAPADIVAVLGCPVVDLVGGQSERPVGGG